jgi:hypothetical protein
MPSVKVCSKCKVPKDSGDFYGKHSWCKFCELAYCKTKWPTISNRTGYKEHRKDYMLQRQYGITVEDFNKLFEQQGRCCKICKTTEPNSKWCVDHDHHNDKAVRGILCSPCNFLLGHAQDSPAILREAANYLEKRVATAAQGSV